jgi:hypothetical protein
MREATRKYLAEKAVRDDGGEDELQTAARTFEALPTVSVTAPTRRTRSTSLGLIIAVFDALVAQGQARLVGSKNEDLDAEYQLLDRFRINVQETAIPAAYDALHKVIADAAVALRAEESAQ